MCCSIVLLLTESAQPFDSTQPYACFVAGADYSAAPAAYPPQSGTALTIHAAMTIPTAPKPAASLLTEPQQKANLSMEKALHASTDTGKLKAVRLCLKAAYVSIQQAASKTVTADTNSDKWVDTFRPPGGSSALAESLRNSCVKCCQFTTPQMTQQIELHQTTSYKHSAACTCRHICRC